MAFRFTGSGDVTASIRRGETTGLRLAGELVLQEARSRVPIEEGTLERSGRVDVEDDTHVSVGFHTPYAARQHEDMTLRHDNGRQAKYLETAVNVSRTRVQAILAQSLRQATS